MNSINMLSQYVEVLTKHNIFFEIMETDEFAFQGMFLLFRTRHLDDDFETDIIKEMKKYGVVKVALFRVQAVNHFTYQYLEFNRLMSNNDKQDLILG